MYNRTSKNYYDILGGKDADDSKIKFKYRKLCLKYHPDTVKEIRKEKQEGEEV